MEKVRTLFSEKVIEDKIQEIADVMNEDYSGVEDVVVIGILRGSVYFMTELTKRLNFPIYLDFMSVSSYGDNTVSSGNVKILKDLDMDIEGKNIIIIEDIIDTGITLSCLYELFKERKTKSIKICTLLNKPERRVPQATITPDYEGFVIPDYFVVGYGLDYAQRYRNLPFIGILEIEE